MSNAWTCPKCGKKFEAEEEFGSVTCPACKTVFSAKPKETPGSFVEESVKPGERVPFKLEDLPPEVREEKIVTIPRRPREPFSDLPPEIREKWIRVEQRQNTLDPLRSIEPAAALPLMGKIPENGAQAPGGLDHPVICPPYLTWKGKDETLFFAPQKMEGVSWKTLLTPEKKKTGEKSAEKKKRRVPLNEHLEIFLKVCEAVDFAHLKGVLHLDVKPEKIMVGEHGEVRLLGWERAVALDDPKEGGEKEWPFLRRSALSEIQGTPAYMAPEQVFGDGLKLDQRTDVYLLGAVLYEVLTGTPPHLFGARLDEIVTKIRRGAVEPPSQRAPRRDIPLELGRIALKALSPKPEDRFETVAELRQVLANYLSGEEARLHSRELTRLAGRDFGRLLIFLGSEAKTGPLPGGIPRLDADLPEDPFPSDNKILADGLKSSSAPIPAALDENSDSPEMGSFLTSADKLYSRLTSLEIRLMRALQLWPENGDALKIVFQVCDFFAERAAENGDLALARSQVDFLGNLIVQTPAGQANLRLTFARVQVSLRKKILKREKQQKFWKVFYLFLHLLIMAFLIGFALWVGSFI